MRVIPFVVGLITVLWGCAHQQARPPGSHPSVMATDQSAAVGVEVVFSEQEIRIIRAYYETQGNDRYKSKRLPPGIAKNLARGKPLPPGIAKHYLPYELRRELPPAPDGYERIVVAGKVLLIEITTQIVRDVLTEAVFG
jgi:Ni/Co efflux regulator RcnB